jgi:PadR family transcriptional regulator PadR
MNSQFKKGVLEMCVLAMVSQRDYYGYELLDTISKKIEISEGAIYPILRRLTQERYFETYLQESSGGPPRKYYRITKRGREAVASLLKEWKSFRSHVDQLIQSGAKS